jgi:hypothetical protein
LKRDARLLQVAGNFHFAPGKSFQAHHMHVHDLQPFKMASWNISHRINRISFGKEFPGIINPLDGVEKTSGKSGFVWAMVAYCSSTLMTCGLCIL